MADRDHMRVCVYCGQQFEVPKRTSVRVFCSSACIGRSARASAQEKLPAERVRPCLQCGSDFSYQVKRGADRSYCSPQCAAVAQGKLRRERKERTLQECASAWCDRPATRIESGYCEACYVSARRHGSPRQPVGPKQKVSSSGYVSVTDRDHPLSSRKGLLYVHRKVAYEKHAGRCPGCYWCGDPLTWEQAVVDHLNEVKDDNRPENLEVSCSRCNRVRGLMPSFVRRLAPERFERFVQITCYAHKPEP